MSEKGVTVTAPEGAELQGSGPADVAPEPDRKIFRDELVAAGLLVLTGTDGIYGRSAVYEDVASAVDGLAVRAAAAEGSAAYRFPPVMPRRVL
jgi:hypothetical protein